MSDLDGQLAFSEVLPAGVDGNLNPLTGEAGDWLEIHNNTGSTVDLSDYFLSDRIDKPTKWAFPDGTLLDQGKHIQVWADNTDTLVGPEYGLHANFGLSSMGESLYIFDAQGVVFDSMQYPSCRADVSYGSTMDGSWLFFANPTPGEANDDASGFLYSGEVQISPEAGQYGSAPTVSITAAAQGTIRYTLDGTEPTENSAIYLSPLQLSGTAVLRARLFEEGFAPGAVATSSYLVGESLTFAAVSLVTDPVHFFDDYTGIYVKGLNGIPGYCQEEPHNWNQPWERPIAVDFLAPDGSLGVHLDGGVKIHGGCSRGNPLKPLALFARGRYGSDRMDYQFFEDRPATYYKSLILRNAGNDYQYTMFRDPLMQAIVEDLKVYTQAYRPVEVFFNGDYWGLHNLREKVNEHWVKSNLDINQDEIDFIKNNWEVFAGTREAWDSLQSFLVQKDFSVEQNYQTFCDSVDIEMYIDYLITQMFFANNDWPGNNQKAFRHLEGDRKWRFILFDLDFGMGLYDRPMDISMFEQVTNNEHDNWPNPRYSTEIMRSLFENEGFVEQFLQRYQVLLNTTFETERVLGYIEDFDAVYRPIIPRVMEQWGPSWRSMGHYDGQVQVLRDFAALRPGYVRNNMRTFFGLGNDALVRVEGPEPWSQVYLNSLVVPDSGMTGSYMSGLDLELVCEPRPGYVFDRWEIERSQTAEHTLVAKGSEWRYLDGGSVPAGDWTAKGFDDASWASGPGALGYSNPVNTTLDFGGDPQNKAISYYFRHSFEAEGDFSWLQLGLLRDDGAIVYLNGQEVVRSNMPAGPVDASTPAITYVGDQDELTYFQFALDTSLLLEGSNLLAVEIHQSSLTSSDLSFDLELKGETMVGGESETYYTSTLKIDPGAGLTAQAYSVPFDADPSAEIFINEIMASADSTGKDWVELYNAGSYDLDLAGYYLSDREEEATRWKIPFGYPDSTTIKAGGFMVFHADKQEEAGPMHAGFRLNANGEFIGLAAISGDRTYWLDSYKFDAQAIDTAMGRYPDGSDSWQFMEPSTPGDSNRIYVYIPVDTGGTDTTDVSLRQLLASQLNIFPNPVRDILSIRLNDPSNSSGVAEAIVMDLGGRVVLRREIRDSGGLYNTTLDFTALPQGIYLLRVESGGRWLNKKVVRAAP